MVLKDFFLEFNRLHRVKEATKRSAEDGLNSLKHTVQKLTEHRLYTLVTADVTEAMETEWVLTRDQ